MLLKSTFLVAALAVGTLASPVHHAVEGNGFTEHVLHERRDTDHAAFVKHSAVPFGRSLPVRIGLTQSNLDVGHDLLMEVSMPGSPKFGQHYSTEEIHELFAPSIETVEAVSGWLKAAGITRFSQSVNKQWMQFDAKVEVLEALVKAKFHEYKHVDTGAIHVACTEYHVPQHVRKHIDYITPGINLISTKTADIRGRALRKRDDHRISDTSIPIGIDTDTLALAPSYNLSSCGDLMTPYCLMVMYNISLGTTNVTGNELGIYEGDDQTFAQSTLNLFYKKFATYVPKGTKPVIAGIDGGGALYPVTPTEAGYSETDLDLEAAIPLIYPQGVILFQTDDKHYETNGTYAGFLNNFFDAIDGSYCSFTDFNETGNDPIYDPPYPDPGPGGYHHALQCGVYKPTNVISISYGEAEASLPVAYQRRQCAEVMKLGMQGVSVIVSSGDSGVDADRSGACLGVDGLSFKPDYPSTCPYITSVGSTVLPSGRNVLKDQEIATVNFASGGGFSNIYKAPDYQLDAIATYFSRKAAPTYPYYSIEHNNGANLTKAGLYNRKSTIGSCRSPNSKTWVL